MSFTAYGSRDDSLVKLRAQNQQILSKEKTKLLEMETEKMAERLQELKIAMSREKEERERAFRDGGFWKSGQVGSLGSYPKEVLSKSAKPKDQISKAKVTLLKDEPIVLPERNKGPGTMALMIKQQPLTPKGGSKVKGRRCGQCEEKAAHVNCTECGEDYCASCFTAFHLKGALKKHRSTPIGSGAMRTPRGELRVRYAGDECKENIQQMPKNSGDKVGRFPVADSGSGVTEKGRMDLSRGDQNDVTGSRKSVAPSSQQRAKVAEGKSLLDGTYDAAENQKQFQEALMEWRQGGKTQEIIESKVSQPTIPRADVAVGTSTNTTVRPVIEVKFSGSDLTYAERLMLKKHHRMELGTVPHSSGLVAPVGEPSSILRSTPIITDVTDEETSSMPSRSSRRSVDAISYSSATGKSVVRTSSAGVRFVDDQGEILPEEPGSRPGEMEFVRKSDSWKQSSSARKTSSARMSSERKKMSPAGSSQLKTGFEQPKISISELKKPLSKRDPLKLERSTTSVNEASGSFSTSTRQTSSRPRVRKNAFGSPSEAEVQDDDLQQSEKFVITQTSVEAFDAPRRALSGYKTTPPKSKTELASVTNKPGRLSSSPSFSKIPSDSLDKSQMKESESGALNESHDLSKMTEPQNFGECEQENSEKITGSESRKTKTKTSSRPGSRAASSRQNPRPKSKNEGRPRSRLASHRENGCLTKAATEALKSVARMSENLTASQNMDLGAYFTMAVRPDRTGVATPVVSSRLNSAREKGRMRVSNSLYQIGPRSWKPESSYIQPSTTDHNDPIENGKGKTSKKTKDADANILSWTLSQELASNKSERIETGESQHFVDDKTGDPETSRDGKSARKVFKPEPRAAQYVLPKQNEAKRVTSLRSSENEPLVTLNRMIPQRPGSGLQGLNSARSQLSTGRDSQMGSRTGRESRSGSRTGRESQMIVYDGDDLSIYEEQEFAKQRREIEEEAKERLDSELALESSLAMKGDSKASPGYKEKAATGSNRSSRSEKLTSKTVSDEYQKLRESMIMNDFEEMEAKLMSDYEDEVKALK